MASYSTVSAASDRSETNHTMYDDLVKTFDCSVDKDILHYLQVSSWDSTGKKEAMTTLVVDEMGRLQGFYALAISLLELDIMALDKKKDRERVQRIATLKDGTIYLLPCILLAQLGKNYSKDIPKEERITGKKLLSYAWEDMRSAQSLIGGVACYLECKDVEILKKFYSDEGFTEIGTTIAKKKQETLIQYIKML